MKPYRFTRREALATGLATAACLAAPAIARSPRPTIAIGGPAYGTQWSITLPDGADGDALRPVLERSLARIDRLVSPWRADSTLSRFNAYRGTQWQPVEAETLSIARAALELGRASQGAFDPTVGPLVARWGFGPIVGQKPSSDATFAIAGDGLRKEEAELTLDLCGIAKGYALDQLVNLLLERGEGDFVVDLGGEVAVRGRHPAGRPWQVAVQDPRQDHAGAAEIVALKDGAIATSGDRENGFGIGTRRYSHIIDPLTAEPVETATASVSVLAADAMTADGWATALMAAGARGPELAHRAGLDALFLMRNGAGLVRLAVGRFDDHLA